MRFALLMGGMILIGGLAGLIAVGCGSSGPDGEPVTSSTVPNGGALRVISIEEALAVAPGTTVRVQGALVATPERVVLASAILESYPPQAGGATLTLQGLDLDSLVGLSSTIGQADLAPVTWTDFWLVLEGVVGDGVLEVTSVPRVVEATVGDLRVRFSPVAEPVRAGEPVWWALDVKNESAVPVDLTFSSGQQGEVVLSQGGVEKYRWSNGKAFTEAIETVTVEPGGTWTAVLTDTLTAPPGDYELSATVTAVVGQIGAGTVLLALETTITVY